MLTKNLNVLFHKYQSLQLHQTYFFFKEIISRKKKIQLDDIQENDSLMIHDLNTYWKADVRVIKKNIFINHFFNLSIMLNPIFFNMMQNYPMYTVELYLDDDSITINLHGII